MARPAERATSPYARDAAKLLGQLIRRARIEKKLTVGGLAERAGVSRGLIQRIERGDTGCAIGAVFEAATIVGVRLFDAERANLTGMLEASASTLTLLPKAVRRSGAKVKDDF
ncbi:MAG: helix-turn-helix transcriptional regulator [Pseudolabrys sp.]